jgi:hypothetical protein
MDSNQVPEDPTLLRLELLGVLARAARLALAENEAADSVTFTVDANPQGMQVDCTLLTAGQPFAGWGV